MEKNLTGFSNYESFSENESDEIIKTEPKKQPIEKKLSKKISASFPGKPKRSLSSYLLFYKTIYKDYLEFDKLPLNEVAQKIGSIWKNLPSEQKAPFIRKAEKLKANYFSEMKKWVENNKNKENFPVLRYQKFLTNNDLSSSSSKAESDNNNDKPNIRKKHYNEHIRQQEKNEDLSKKYQKVSEWSRSITKEWKSKTCSHEEEEYCIFCKIE